MTKEDLIPIKTTERAKELGRRGGLVRSEAKTEANIFNASKVAKCKYCPATYECPYKEMNLEENPEQVCTIPEARGKAKVLNAGVMTEEVIEGLTRKGMEELRKTCVETKDFKMYCDVALALWNKLYPTVQKNVNLNVNRKDMAQIWVEEMLKECDEKRESAQSVEEKERQKPTETANNAPIENKEKDYKSI